MILTKGPGPESFKETLIEFLKPTGYTQGNLMWNWQPQQRWLLQGVDHNCSKGDQQGSPNSFHTTLIKRLSLAPSQCCQAVFLCNCFHIFFEQVSFILVLCLFLLSWTLNLWLLIHVYHSILPCTEPEQIRNSTKGYRLSSDVNITRIATLWHLSHGFQSTFTYLMHPNSVKPEGQDFHVQMRAAYIS